MTETHRMTDLPVTRRERVLTLFLALAGVTAVAVWAWWSLERDPDAAYLPEMEDAHWIVDPRPSALGGRRLGAVDTTFESRFELEMPPLRATAELRAFRRCELLVNGELVLDTGAGDPFWKRTRSVDVTARLRAGTNTVTAVVTNPTGRPALCLQLRTVTRSGRAVTTATDESWTASHGGAAAAPAVRASGRHRTAREGVETGGPTAAALRRWWPLLVAVVAVAAALWAWGSRMRFVTGPVVGRVILIAGIALIVARFVNNAPVLRRDLGFDVRSHVQNVQIILDEGRLPRPGEGPQSHQPPLYYLLAAATARAAGADLSDREGVLWLRSLSLVLGIAQFLLIGAILGRLVPTAAGRNAGLALTLFLPVHALMFEYVTNESLAAVLGAAAVLCLLRSIEHPGSLLRHGLLGLCLGGLVLAKSTGFVLVPAALILVAAAHVRAPAAGRLVRSLVAVALPLIAVGGWHYLAAWQSHGTPFVRFIDIGSDPVSWQDPGYLTHASMLRFGRVLKEPFFAGFDSCPDAFYSTLWGDGRLSGCRFAPPGWDLDLMRSGYLLALVPTALIVAGALDAAWTLVRRPSLESLVAPGLLVSMAAAQLRENLAHPYLTLMKSWYALPVMAAVVVLFARAYAGCGRRLRAVLFVLLVAWAAASYLGFWLDRDAAAVQTMLAAEGVADDPEAAVRRLGAVIERHPRSAVANYRMGLALDAAGRRDEAREHAERAASLDPGHAAASALAGRLECAHGDVDLGLRRLDHAVALAPHAQAISRARAMARLRHRPEAAGPACEEWLPFALSGRLRQGAAWGCREAGDPRRAFLQWCYAMEMEAWAPDFLDTFASFARKIVEEELRREDGDAGVLAAAAWLSSTSAETRVRGLFASELPFARAADERTQGAHPWALRVLAAALAEAGDHRAAAAAARRALSGLDPAHGLAVALRRDLAAFDEGSPIRRPARPPRVLLLSFESR